MHGRGDSIDGFRFLPDALALPSLEYVLLNAPDPYYTGWSWYDLPPHQAPGILRSRAAIFAELDAIIASGIAPSDILLFGFSQGCLMAIDVGLRYPQPLGGVCGCSGYVFFTERIAAEATPHAKHMPWLITHGRFDDMLPIDTTREQVALLRAAGIPVEWHEFDKDHTIDPDDELPLLRRWFAQRLANQTETET